MSERMIRLPRPRLFAPEQLQRVVETGVRILLDHGLRVLHPKAREAAAQAGLRVEGDRVFPDQAAISQRLEETRSSGARRGGTGLTPAPTAPPQLALHACEYATHVHDLDTDAILPFTTDRLIEAAKLIDSLAPQGLIGGAPGAPSDVPGHLQPLLQYQIQAQHCRHGRHPIDAKWAASVPYVMEMAEVLGHPIRSLPVYVVTPLTIGAESLESVLAVLPKLERIHTGNMPSVGGTTPVRIADALALGVGEAVGSAIVLQAITNLPVSWGVGAQAFDLRGMAMSFGGPEHQLFRWAAEEMNAFCHGYTPDASGGWAAMRSQAKLPGPQAAAEKMAGAVTAALTGARELDGAGTLSLDEVFSAEQLIFDCEIRDHVQRLVAGIEADIDPQACLSDISEGIEGGFMALDSTLSQYRDVYWLPTLMERRSLAAWLAAGAPDLRRRAKELARQQVKKHDYELPSDLLRELNRIYARAERELAA